MMVIGRFDALFRHGPHCEAMRPIGDVQRIHAARFDVQVAAVAHAVRNGRPKVTGALHIAERTIGEAARARSGEIDRGVLTAVGKEVPAKVSRKVGGILGALYVHFFCLSGIESCSGKPCEGVVGRQVEADRTGVVNRFDHGKVITGIRNLRSGIIGRP